MAYKQKHPYIMQMLYILKYIIAGWKEKCEEARK